MEALIRQLDKKDSILIIKDNCRGEHLKQRPDDAGSNILKPIWKIPPDA
jgi:hypothetical protein